jgi:hypothetical protein
MEEYFITSLKQYIFNKRNGSQLKARELWNLMKYEIPKTQRLQFEIDWNQYILDELNLEKFQENFNKNIILKQI